MVDESTAIRGRKKVVVVEDEPEIREIEVFLLASEGYAVIGLDDGESVKETVKREGADLLVLDLMLPKKSGFEVLDELAHDDATSHLPVIVVSAYAFGGNRDVLRGSPQVARVIHKPFDITELLEAIESELGHRAGG